MDHELPEQFELLPSESLAEQLRRFYGHLASKCGDEYSKSSLVNIRAGLNRHLTSPPWNLQINLMHDRVYQGANQVFSGLIRDYRRRGLDVSCKKSAVTAADVELLYSSGTLSNKSPQSLLYKVYFELSLHCARRGCEGLRDLRKDSFVVRKDENGREYVCLAYHELEKNHQGINKREGERDPRLYAQVGDPNCPVLSFKKYISKLNGACESFFQRPKQTFHDRDSVWFVNAPMGKNKLFVLMKDISKKAGLSKVYTNHCLRVTSATVLSRNNISPLDICSVTGHRNVESVKSYVDGTSDEQRYRMSRLLHSHGKSASTETALAPVAMSSASSVSGVETSVTGDTPVQSRAICTSESAVVATEPQPGPSNFSMSNTSSNQINLEKLTHSLFSGVTFAANSNPVFNINFH